MRLCPAAPIVVRKLLEPMELGGYTIPAGTTVAPCVHLVHRRAGHLPRAAALPARALPGASGRHLHVDPVRRRRAALSGRPLRAAADEAGDRHGASREVDLRAVEPRSERARKSAIAFVPHRHALVIAKRRERSRKTSPPLSRAGAIRSG